MWVRALASILVLGSCFPRVIAASENHLIQAIEIRGTRRPVELETHAGERLDETRIERDVRRLWATGRFDNILVESTESAGGVRLTFRLIERPELRLRRIKFEPGRAHLKLDLEKGDAVDRVVAKRTEAKLWRQLVEEGYASARVKVELKPVGPREADLHVRIERGRANDVREVRFSGPSMLRTKELQRALRSTRPRRLLPGWWLFQPLSEQRLQADAERLRSLYFSRGYLDARVEVGAVSIKGGKATVTFNVDSGRRYSLRQVGISETATTKQLPPQTGRAFSTKELCQCILKTRRQSEKRGELGFSAELELRDALAPTAPSVDLTAKINPGPAYRVGRIEFSGLRGANDVTLRRALLLKEGDLFDQVRLRRSLTRLGQFSFLKPVSTSDAHAELDPNTHLANLRIRVKETRGQWSVSGFPPQFTIRTRLLPLGHGPLALSTYYATFSLLTLPSPWGSLLTSAPRVRWQAFGALERPYLPGQSWQSGFLLSPELGWRRTVAGFGLQNALQPLRSALAPDPSGPSGISVPAWWHTAETEGHARSAAAGVLNCEEHKSSWARLRTAGFGVMSVAANGFLPAMLPY